MNWMKKWAGAFPIFVKSAKGAHFIDVDGRDYVDLCLGDTGAMTGHSPEVVAEAVARRVREGVTLMLPTEDSLWVGEDLKRRFGLPYWQFTLTATDANRFSIRIAREITQRSKILVFHYCYHGTVDESFAALHDGVVGPRRGNIGPPVNPAETTRVVEFNDLNALEAALKHHDVACVLAEPAMTNVGIILPDDGYWKSARELCRRYGSLLIADETHTICVGPGGCTAEWKLDPDMLVFGKAIGSGIPGATYGVTEEVAQRINARIHLEDCDVGGIGGTLAGNALSIAAMRATLEHVLTPKSFEHMIPLAKRFNDGVAAEIRAHDLPWNVIQLGARAEYTFARKTAAQRRRIRRCHRFRTRALPPPLRPQPRRPADTVPQHGADVPRHHRSRHRRPHQNLRLRRPRTGVLSSTSRACVDGRPCSFRGRFLI